MRRQVFSKEIFARRKKPPSGGLGGVGLVTKGLTFALESSKVALWNAALAEFLGISAGRMSQIAVDGVPVKYMPAVRDFTKGAVTLDVMVAKRATEPERVA